VAAWLISGCTVDDFADHPRREVDTRKLLPGVGARSMSRTWREDDPIPPREPWRSAGDLHKVS